VPVALSLAGGFAVGFALRAWLQRYFAVAFRTQFALGMGSLAVLAGWAFDGGVGDLAALGLLLAAQVSAVLLGAWVFRRRREGPVLGFSMFGNPTMWSLPIAAAAFGPRAAVVLAAYDMLTMPRIALGVRLLRRRAPIPQAPRTALADYAPMAGAVAGVLLGRFVEAPDAIPGVVSVFGTVLAASSALLLGVAWPSGRWFKRHELTLSAKALALHVTFVPGVLLAASLAGLAIPPALWVLVLGPFPMATLSFARLYGFSACQAASGLALSTASAVALLPLALALP
jgi:predicted permease